MQNRLHNCTNPNQGESKKVLCLCSAGLLRSPTAAFVLSSPPYNFNTRSAGVAADYALIPVDQVLLEWADEIVVMEEWQAKEVHKLMEEFLTPEKEVFCLGVPDKYGFKDPDLIKLIKKAYDDIEIMKQAIRINEKHG